MTTVRFITRGREESFLMTRAERRRNWIIYQFYPLSFSDNHAERLGVAVATSTAAPRYASGVDAHRLLSPRQPTTARLSTPS
jgi:hypothetical protein